MKHLQHTVNAETNAVSPMSLVDDLSLRKVGGFPSSDDGISATRWLGWWSCGVLRDMIMRGRRMTAFEGRIHSLKGMNFSVTQFRASDEVGDVTLQDERGEVHVLMISMQHPDWWKPRQICQSRRFDFHPPCTTVRRYHMMSYVSSTNEGAASAARKVPFGCCVSMPMFSLSFMV